MKHKSLGGKTRLKNWLQLASIPVDSFIFRIELPNPELLSDGQDHGVLAPDLLQDGHGHVRHLVTGTIEVDPVCLVQVGPRLPVSPRHTDPVLVHAVFKATFQYVQCTCD